MHGRMGVPSGRKERRLPLLTPQSFVDVVRERADRLGAKRAFTFLADGEEPAEQLTFAELDRRAREVGAAIARLVADPELRARMGNAARRRFTDQGGRRHCRGGVAGLFGKALHGMHRAFKAAQAWFQSFRLLRRLQFTLNNQGQEIQ